MTDKQDPIAHAARLLREAAEELRQAHAYRRSEGLQGETGAQSAYDVYMAAAQAIEEWEMAVGAGGMQPITPQNPIGISAEQAPAAINSVAQPVPAGFVTAAAFDRLHAHAEQLAARLLADDPAAPQAAPAQEPTEQQAHDMGAKGAPATDAERLLFEAWMRGHCWALCATWDGACYRSDAERDGFVDPRAMNTRQLWAAWRDRAALARQGDQP